MKMLTQASKLLKKLNSLLGIIRKGVENRTANNIMHLEFCVYLFLYYSKYLGIIVALSFIVHMCLNTVKLPGGLPMADLVSKHITQ